ncbi:MAG: low temperature requirement protein A [Candidatus Nanopelagicales bacterium]
MTSPTASAQPGRYRLVPMRPRDPNEPGRSATPLELFFDLVFVVAVSIAAAQLHHSLTENHVLDGLFAYAIVFFGIWWAWMNFTWFATSFATDDWLYRLLTFVQMAGVLVLAAGIEAAFVDREYDLLVYGYVVMRFAMVAQWSRASRHAGSSRRATQIYAVGIAILQILWLVMLTLPQPLATITLVVLVTAELAVPIIAELRGQTPWHPHHITERYGLFALIVLGESLLASTNAIIEALHEQDALAPLVSIAVLTLVVTAALWWIYFWPPHYTAIGSFAKSLRYGYVHYFVFASAAAFSAGIEVEIDVVTDHSQLSDVAAAFTVSIPITVFMLSVWWVAIQANADRLVNTTVLAGAVLVLLEPLLPAAFTLTAIIMTLVVVVLVLRPPTHGEAD